MARPLEWLVGGPSCQLSPYAVCYGIRKKRPIVFASCTFLGLCDTVANLINTHRFFWALIVNYSERFVGYVIECAKTGL